MGFKILDIENFIKEKKAQEVSSPKTFFIKSGIFTPDPDGLYSPQIFGNTLKDKREKFGYIDLKTVIFHPFIYKNLKKISGIFESVAKGKKKVRLIDGELIEDDQGQTGIDFLIKIWNEINFDKYKKKSNEDFIDFLKYTKDNLIKINKTIVIPILY